MPASASDGRIVLAAERVVVLGVGNPWSGDLDFGPQFIRRYGGLDWPPHVMLLEGALAAQRVLHLLQDLRPARLVIVAAYPRGEAAGTIRRYHVGGPPPADAEVHARLGESAAGVIDLDHILAVNRFYGTIGEHTTVIEVEAVDPGFGTSFSPRVEASFEEVLELVQREIAAAAPR